MSAKDILSGMFLPDIQSGLKKVSHLFFYNNCRNCWENFIKFGTRWKAECRRLGKMWQGENRE